MKHFMWKLGVNPLEIPNGIPESSLDDVDAKASSRLAGSLDADLILAKIARWDPDKRWNAAFEAAARLKARGLRTVLLARGGIEQHGEEVLRNARSLGLRVKDIVGNTGSLKDQLDAIGDREGADVLNIRFNCSPELLQDATKLTPERAVKQVTPDSLRYLHPGAHKFFKEKGVLT